jgi:V/A-type H+-transporting ATPase subunit D
MPERELTPTHSAFLELKEERAGMQEGYSFLDEKRLILASEILSELARYEEEMADFRRVYRAASLSLQAAIARHGLEGVEIYPPAPTLGGELRLRGQAPPPRSLEQSPEADACREAFRDLVPRAAHLAARIGNLERLRSEYTKTARRARALEDVLLPEIDETLRAIDSALEELDREEAVRVRHLDV